LNTLVKLNGRGANVDRWSQVLGKRKKKTALRYFARGERGGPVSNFAFGEGTDPEAPYFRVKGRGERGNASGEKKKGDELKPDSGWEILRASNIAQNNVQTLDGGLDY